MHATCHVKVAESVGEFEGLDHVVAVGVAHEIIDQLTVVDSEHALARAHDHVCDRALASPDRGRAVAVDRPTVRRGRRPATLEQRLERPGLPVRLQPAGDRERAAREHGGSSRGDQGEVHAAVEAEKLLQDSKIRLHVPRDARCPMIRNVLLLTTSSGLVLFAKDVVNAVSQVSSLAKPLRGAVCSKRCPFEARLVGSLLAAMTEFAMQTTGMPPSYIELSNGEHGRARARDRVSP